LRFDVATRPSSSPTVTPHPYPPLPSIPSPPTESRRAAGGAVARLQCRRGGPSDCDAYETVEDAHDCNGRDKEEESGQLKGVGDDRTVVAYATRRRSGYLKYKEIKKLMKYLYYHCALN